MSSMSCPTEFDCTIVFDGRKPGDFGPVSALLQQRYWALHDDPNLVAAVINLANIRYACGELPEAQARA